ncbi:MAG: hypothetical protein LHV68_06230 [Elusimicrobia bacterium]|nr:hypothetical protein [Candidatus Liberimonas magnetica]
MRLSVDKIKEAINHPEEEIRLMAVEYFSKSFSPDETLMPLVIRGIEKDGRKKAYKLLSRAVGLEQTSSSIEWILSELCKDTLESDTNHVLYYSNLSEILATSNPGLLLKYQSQIVGTPNLFKKFCAELGFCLFLSFSCLTGESSFDDKEFVDLRVKPEDDRK